jgi:hypothetical protein
VGLPGKDGAEGDIVCSNSNPYILYTFKVITIELTNNEIFLFFTIKGSSGNDGARGVMGEKVKINKQKYIGSMMIECDLYNKI